MNWITTGRFVWCVLRQRIVINPTHADQYHICEGPHRQVAVLLHSPDEYVPKEKHEVTTEIPAGKPVPLEETTKPGEGTNYIETNIQLNPERHYCQLYEHVMSRQSCAISGYTVLPKTEGFHEPGAFVKGRRSPYIKHKSYSQQLAALVEENIVTPEEFDKAMENATPVDVDVQLDRRVTTGEYLHGKSSDWVLVRGQVKDISSTKLGDYIDVEFPTISGDKRVLAVVPSEVVCYTLPPVPPEPHPNNLLVSKASGRVFQYSDSSHTFSAGWHEAFVSAKRVDWKTLWKEHGPFQEYYASRPLNGSRP